MYYLILNTRNVIDSNQKAKMLFLVHLSKANIEKKLFIECFRGFETIEIKINFNDYSFVEKFDFILTI